MKRLFILVLLIYSCKSSEKKDEYYYGRSSEAILKNLFLDAKSWAIKINSDSISLVWKQIYTDNAALGLQYAKDIDSIYRQKNSELTEKKK